MHGTLKLIIILVRYGLHEHNDAQVPKFVCRPPFRVHNTYALAYLVCCQLRTVLHLETEVSYVNACCCQGHAYMLRIQCVHSSRMHVVNDIRHLAMTVHG